MLPMRYTMPAKPRMHGTRWQHERTFSSCALWVKRAESPRKGKECPVQSCSFPCCSPMPEIVSILLIPLDLRWLNAIEHQLTRPASLISSNHPKVTGFTLWIRAALGSVCVLFRIHEEIRQQFTKLDWPLSFSLCLLLNMFHILKDLRQ